MTRDLFFELIAISLGHKETFDVAPTEEEWSQLLNLSKKQSIVGLTFTGMDSLPRTQRPPLRIYSMWALLDEKIEQVTKANAETAGIICKGYMDKGFDCCVLKGSGIAYQFYPIPERRQSGDIDIWVDFAEKSSLSGRGKRNALLRSFGKFTGIGDICYHHFDAGKVGEIPVEVHIHPSFLNNPFANRKLQSWFESCSYREFSNLDPSVGFPAPEIRFCAVHTLLHIFRHLFHEGIGLRQIFDIYFILDKLDSQSRSEVYEFLYGLGLGRFIEALMWVLEKVFDLPGEKLLCKPDPASGVFLLDEIMKSGNFGMFDKRNSHKPDEGLLSRAERKLKRLASLYEFSPSECLWAPFYKVWQHIEYKWFVEPKFSSAKAKL